MFVKTRTVYLTSICLSFLVSCTRNHEADRFLLFPEIQKYPSLYSYRTDSLRNVLTGRKTTFLPDSDKKIFFSDEAFNGSEYTGEILFGGKYKIFPLNKISYSGFELGIFLVNMADDEGSYLHDKVSLVLYGKDKKPAQNVNIDLLNSFGSKEVNFVSPNEFEIIEFDNEYSPDPESEAEDIKNGKKILGLKITTVYLIDTVAGKFVEKDKWQEDVPDEEQVYSEVRVQDGLFFESTSPNASRATPLYEYIKMNFLNDSVWGTGAGDYMAGSQPWTLTFNGKLKEEGLLELEVSYDQKDEKPYTESESWTLDKEKGRLYRKDWAKSKNDKGAEEYHSIDVKDIPEEFYKKIKNEGTN